MDLAQDVIGVNVYGAEAIAADIVGVPIVDGLPVPIRECHHQKYEE